MRYVLTAVAAIWLGAGSLPSQAAPLAVAPGASLFRPDAAVHKAKIFVGRHTRRTKSGRTVSVRSYYRRYRRH